MRELPNPISSVRAAAPHRAEFDGYEHHPVEDIEPLLEGRTYRQACEDMLAAMNIAIMAIANSEADAQGIGALWALPSYRGYPKPNIDIELDIDELRSHKEFSSVYLGSLGKMIEIVPFIATKSNQVMAAWCVGAQLGLEFCGGLSMQEIGNIFGVSRQAISNYVREFQQRGINSFTSDYQKPEAARQACRAARLRYLKLQKNK